ncbi:hypothetical protein BD779DRAFT_427694 [Infundibulicybe gibba]|nr:hypothetical protein BD779DRAFT_427694 [Infundibulicybe gibba]
MRRLLTLPPNSLRVLQSLEIVIRGRATPVADPIPFSTAFGPHSQLHTFELTAPRYINQPLMHLRIGNFNVPWHRLTTLTLHSPSIPAYEPSTPSADASPSNSVPLIACPSSTTSLEIGSWSFLTPQPPYHLSTHSGLGLLNGGLRTTIMLFFAHFTFLTSENSSQTTTRAPHSGHCQYSSRSWAMQSKNLIYPGSSSLRICPRRWPWTMMRALGDGTVSSRLTTLYLEFVERSQFLLDILETRAAAARTSRDIAALNVMVLRREKTSANPLDEARLAALAEAGMRIHLDVTDSRVR